MKDFRRLNVWQKAHALVLLMYRATRAFPGEERYGLTNQSRRAAASIPANIAEGCGRGSDKDMRRFLQIALGSASELEYHLLLARDLSFLPDTEHDQLHDKVTEIKRMLTALIKKLSTDR